MEMAQNSKIKANDVITVGLLHPKQLSHTAFAFSGYVILGQLSRASWAVAAADAVTMAGSEVGNRSYWQLDLLRNPPVAVGLAEATGPSPALKGTDATAALHTSPEDAMRAIFAKWTRIAAAEHRSSARSLVTSSVGDCFRRVLRCVVLAGQTSSSLVGS